MSKELDDYREVAKRRQERVKTDKFKLNVGDNTIRILKTPKGVKSTPVLFEFSMHNNVGPEKSWIRCGINPLTGKGSCWICQKLIPKLERQGKESRASALAPETRMVIQVASISESGKWSGPHLFFPSGKKADEITSLIMSKRRDYVDPKRGYNIGISRTGTGKNDTRYGPLEPDQESSKVPSKIQEALKPFDELKQIPKYDEDKQKKAYYGEDGPDEDAKKSSRSRKDGDEEDYDEDVDDSEDDEDDDDEPKKKKKSKSSKKKKSRDEDEDDDEDYDDDEDEDDDDEDEEPVRKKKKKVLKKKKKTRR